ncbi:MAG: hypothetical protein J5509_00860 [Lachnospiraceae bacterium]|nr:hypothetical protein [Lachnospiraceae bacterium]
MDIYGAALKLDDDDDRYSNAYKWDVIEANKRYEYFRRRHPGFSHIRRVAILWAAIAVLLVVIIRFLSLQFELDNHRNRIVNMNKQLTEITGDNDEEYRRLTGSVDLIRIRDIAMNELGMVYATPDQIVSFNTFEYDYVKQTADIEQ